MEQNTKSILFNFGQRSPKAQTKFAMGKSKEVVRLEEVVSGILNQQKKYSDNSANGLSNCILDFLNIVKGQQCERVHSSGIPFIDPVTKEQRFARPKTTNGTADLSACIHSKCVKIEIKIGTDRQSKSQKEYQNRIEGAGGVYYIAKDFSSFSWWYRRKFEL